MWPWANTKCMCTSPMFSLGMMACPWWTKHVRGRLRVHWWSFIVTVQAGHLTPSASHQRALQKYPSCSQSQGFSAQGGGGQKKSIGSPWVVWLPLAHHTVDRSSLANSTHWFQRLERLSGVPCCCCWSLLTLRLRLARDSQSTLSPWRDWILRFGMW